MNVGNDTDVLPPMQPNNPRSRPAIQPNTVLSWGVLIIGFGMLISQTILVIFNREASVPIIGAGVTLLTTWPALKIGERRNGS
jgi:hypothetical protein